MSAKGKGKRKKSSKSSKSSTKKGRDVQVEVSAPQQLITAISQRLEANKEALRYVALFLGFCLGLYLVYYYLIVSESVVMAYVRENTAILLGGIFSLIGAEVAVHGAVVSVDGFGLEIIDECTAIFSSIVFCASVAAYPTTLKKKALGMLLGVPALYAINIFRLFVLTLVGISAPNLFEFVHVYLWQASFIIFVVVLFLLWLRFVVK